MDILELKGMYDSGYTNGVVIYSGMTDFNTTPSDYRFGKTIRSKKLIESRMKNKRFIIVRFPHMTMEEKILVFTEDDVWYDKDATVGDAVSLRVNVQITAKLNVFSRKDSLKFKEFTKEQLDERRKFRNMSDKEIEEYAKSIRVESRDFWSSPNIKGVLEYSNQPKEEMEKLRKERNSNG